MTTHPPADRPEAALFRPALVGPLDLPNRFVMAPMTRCRAGAGNAPTPLSARYYAQRASAGLIIAEATQVCPEGVGYVSTPGIHTPEQAAGWRIVTDAVHAAGGRIFLQLWHVGRLSHESFQPGRAAPVAPSAVAAVGDCHTPEGKRPFAVPRALATDEVPGVVEQFAAAARLAREAGFDGVEIHAANGYLIDQFLRDGSNRRTDRYGGPLDNRLRFLLEVVGAVAGEWGADRVGVRLSPRNMAAHSMHDTNPGETFPAAAAALDRLGLAYLHVLELLPGHPWYTDDGRAPLTPALRRAFRGPLIVNGGYSAEAAGSAVAGGAADLAAFGVLFLANPDLPARVASGAVLNTPRPELFYGGGEEGYTDYPALDAAS